MCLAVLAVLAAARPTHAQLSVGDLTATANGATQIDLSWTAPTFPAGFSISGYHIQVSPSGNNGTWTTLAANTDSAATTYSHTELTPNSTRYYRLQGAWLAQTGAEAALDSNVASATTDAATVPGAPTGLTATANGQTQIDLSWTAPTDTGGVALTGYKIEVSSSGNDGTWTTLVADTGSTGTTYSHSTGLTPGTTRHYRVSGINAKGAGDPSNEASASTDALKPPTGLRARANGKTRIELAWTAPTGLMTADATTSYKIETSPSGAVGSWTNLVADTGSTATTYTHTDLTAGTTRHYRVSTINANGTSAPSNEASATTAAAGAPGAPTGLTATADGQHQIGLSWTAPAGGTPTGYKIEVSPSGNDRSWTTLEFNTGSTATTYTHTRLGPATRRYYRVSAINAEGTGDPSATASATTTGDSVRLEPLPGALKLSWNAVPGVTGRYLVGVKCCGAQSFTAVDDVPNTARSYTITGLTPGTEYTVRLRGRAQGSTVFVRDLTGTPLLGKVSGVSATAASRTSLRVGWSAAAAAQSYEVQWRRPDTGQDWSGERRATTTSTSHTIMSLTAGTAYSVRVRARRSDFPPGPWSDEASATTRNLTATAVSTASATLNVTGHPGTWYYKYTSPSGGTCSGAQGGTSADVTGLKAGQDYTFATYSDSLCASMLASVSFRTTSEPLTDLTATPVGATLVVRWKSDGQPGTKTPHYIVRWKLESSQSYTPGSDETVDALSGVSSYTTTITGLRRNTAYTVRVDFYEGLSLITQSSVTATTGFPTPRDVTVTATATSLTVRWKSDGVYDFTKTPYYDVWWKLESSQDYPSTNDETVDPLAGTTAYTHTITDLEPDTAYTVRVRFNEALTLINEATATATTPVADVTEETPPPTDLTATATGSGEVDLSWTAPSVEGRTIDDYMVQWESASGDDLAEMRTGSTDATATVRGLRPGTEYTFYVRAVFDDGTASPSATATATTTAATVKPGAPTGLTATAIEPTAIELSWTAAPGAGVTGHRIEFQTPDTSGPWTPVPVLRDGKGNVVEDVTTSIFPGYTHGNLSPGTRYRYRVKAINAIGESGWASSAWVTTDTHEGIAFWYVLRDKGVWPWQGFVLNMPEAYRPGGSAPHGPYTYALALGDGSPLPNWLRFDAATRELTTTDQLAGPHNPVEETVALEWTAAERDDSSVSASQTFTLHRCMNEDDRQIKACEESHPDNNDPGAPKFKQAPTDQTATEDEAFSYTAPEATDSDDDPITYSAALADGSALPDWLAFTATARAFAGTPGTDDAPAELEIKVTASDGTSETSVYFTLTVEEAAGGVGNANSAPAFTSGAANQTATEGEAFSYIVPAATDPDEDDLTYTAALTDGGDLPDWLSFAAGTRTFSGTPDADDAPAELDITVTATDDGNPPESGTTSFTLTVEEAGGAVGASNTAPAFRTGASDQTATVGEAFSYTAPAAVDAENHALTYTAALTDGNALPDWLGFAAGTRTFSGTPGGDDGPAALDVTVTATDTGSPPQSGSTTFALTVKGSPPTADAGSDVEGKRGEEGVVLDGSGTAHADGSQSLTYLWEIAGASHTELEGLGSSLGGADSADATFTVPRRRDMTDRGALDDGNWIDLKLTVTDGDGESASDTMRLTIRGTTWQEIFAGVADAEAEESSGSIDFVVTLDAAGRDSLSVDWATADGTATAGNDFTADSGTLTFAAGETSKTVSVKLLDDAIDEGKETFSLQLSNPQPPGTLMLDDAQATGTITNVDPLQTAWLARFGRAVATAAVDALGDRIERRAQVRSGAGGTDADLSLLQSFFLSGAGGGAAGYGGYGGGPGQIGSGAPGHGMPGHGSAPGGTATGSRSGGVGSPAGMVGQQHAGLGGMPMGGAGGGGMPMGGMPMGGAPMRPDGSGPEYHLPAGSLFLPGGEGNRWTGWARTSTGHFSSLGGPLPLQGQMRMGIFGADYELGRLLAGVAIAHGRGEGAITAAELGRAYSAHSSLTSVHPYAAFDLAEDLTLWGQVGYGGGEMALVESHVRGAELEQAGAYRTGNSLAMAAVGARGALGEVGGFSLAVESDAFVVRTTSDAVTAAGAGNLAAGAAGANRVRAALEASRALRFAGRSLTPSVELGIRQDGGDAETGLGLETGFGVVYSDPKLGLMVDATLNLLVAHQDSRYDEWGFSGSVRFDPGMAGRGLSLNVTPSFGSASQGAGRLWAMQDLGGLVPYGGVPFDTGGQFAAELGYGMAGPGGRGAGTPYAGLTRSGMGHRAMRYGYRWEVGQGFNVGVEGARQGGAAGFAQPAADGAGEQLGGAQHSLQVRGGVSF